MADKAVLDKLAKLHKAMEGAKAVNSEEEADAFAGMMQRLLAKYKLEMSDIQYEQFEQAEPIERFQVDYEKYPEIKLRHSRVKWIEDLAYFVAQAYNCRILVRNRTSFITMVGRKTDAEIAEWMFVKLHRIAEKIADKEYVKYFYECRDKGEVYLARGFRQAFLNAFVQRINRRFDEERAKLQREHSTTALVRVSLAQVDKHIAETVKGNAAALSRHRWNAAGQDRGRKAADAINLGQQGVHGSNVKGHIEK